MGCTAGRENPPAIQPEASGTAEPDLEQSKRQLTKKETKSQLKEESKKEKKDQSQEKKGEVSPPGESKREEENEAVEADDASVHFVTESGGEGLQGLRPTMEDTHVLLDYIEEASCSFYGVYDGHCGKDAANFCEEYVHKNIISDEAFLRGDVENAIINGFCNTDKLLLEKGVEEGWKNGATAVVCLIHHKTKTIFVANVGDSEAIIAQKKISVEPNGHHSYEPILVTEKHKAAAPSEKKRIQEAGGTVISGRVYGDLAISRSFGDGDYKRPKTEGDMICVQPHVKKVKMKPFYHDFLVLACDGLWDVMNYQDSINFVALGKREGKSAAEVSKELAEEALKRKSQDNVTVIVVYINWSSTT